MSFIKQVLTNISTIVLSFIKVVIACVLGVVKSILALFGAILYLSIKIVELAFSIVVILPLYLFVSKVYAQKATEILKSGKTLGDIN